MRVHPAADIVDNLPPVITGRQLRAARTLTGLSRKELAERARISEGTVIAQEQRGKEPITALLETRLSLVEALWQAGVVLGNNESTERRKLNGR